MLTPNEALAHLNQLESDADNRLAVLGDQLGEALAETDFGRLFMLERAFEQTWRRRERIRNTWRCAQETLDDTAA
ncbi:MAG: hypothetical protein L6R28_25465 [Planctomycetes bacterium]|nr:hypothetical protein [Planctomycetota bacterium]